MSKKTLYINKFYQRKKKLVVVENTLSWNEITWNVPKN